jgi:hypothetical protein
MIEVFGVLCSCVFLISLLLCFTLCDENNKVVWPILLCFVSFVLMFVCIVLTELKGDNKDKTDDYLCPICNKIYQVKKSDNIHSVKVSAFRSVYVCDDCFKTKEDK